MNAPTRTTRTVTYPVAVLMALAGLVFVAPPAHATVHQVHSGGVIYSYDDTNPAAGASVTEYTPGPNQQLVTILDTVDIPGVGVVPVKSIADTATFNDKNLTGVGFVGENLLSIGNNAFAGSALTTVDIPDSVTSIGEGAFFGNSLTTVTIGEGVTTIGTSAFFANPLTSVRIPDNVTSIGSGAFGFNSLNSVVVGDSVTSIEDNAFDGNPTLTSVRFTGPAPTVTEVGPNESFDIAGGSLVLHYPFEFADEYTPTPWYGYTTAPYGVTKILNGISYWADETNIAAGAKVTDYNTASGFNVTIPSTVSILGQSYNVTEIGQGAFQLKNITSVSIPNTVKVIGPQAFSSNHLSNVVIPNSVTVLGADAFNSSSLTSVTISNTLTTIGPGAFSTNQLTDVTIPASVTSISANAFYANPLTDITFPVAVNSVGPDAFGANDLLTAVRFLGPGPGTVTSLGVHESFDAASGALIIYYQPAFAINFPALWHGYTTKPYLTGLAPTITGRARETYTLTAVPGPVDLNAGLAYQWNVDGEPIAGATADKYVPKKADAGRRLSVTVTATYLNADPLIKTSPSTTRISSPYKRLFVSATTVHRGQNFVVVGTGYRKYQRVKIILGGVTRYKGRADANGTISRWVSFASSTSYGTRSVRVSGYDYNWNRTSTIVKYVTYVS